MSEFTKGKLTANGRRLEIEGRKGYTGNYRVADAYANTALSNCPSLDEAQANAARLAHCWNCHTELLESCKNLLAIVTIQNGNLHKDINEIQESANAIIRKALGLPPENLYPK